MALPGWFENLLHNGTAAGLSGIPALQLSSDPDRDWFLRFLRVHYTTQSLSLWPERMWSPKAGAREGTGLRTHLESVVSGGVLSASQVLVVLSKAELEEAVAKNGPGWILQEERRLTGLVQSLLEERRIRVPGGLDDLNVRLVKDGDRRFGSRPLNLLPGEFVTGLLPNRHIGEGEQVLGVYVHIPGAWEGFRPVSAVTDHQLLYTLGNHWLDNFQHPSLPEGALYQLSRDNAERWIHSVHPDHRKEFRLQRTRQEGAMDVVSLVNRDGQGILDVQLVPLGRTLDGVNRSSTVISEISNPSPQGLLSLRETGLLLQRVHFPQVMRGYDVYIAQDGSMTTSSSSPLAVIEVRGAQAALSSRSELVKVNGKLLPPNRAQVLTGQCEILVGDHRLIYRDLSEVEAAGWPYVGEIRRSGWKSHLPVGGRYIIGRAMSAWVRLPDVADSRNVRWADETSSASVDSRTGTFARKDFYTDSIMVASEHAAVDLREGAMVENQARHCSVFVRRDNAVIALLPKKKAGRHRMDLEEGDELLVGNCVFAVGGEVPTRQHGVRGDG